jgi:hypothetical protein
MYNIDAKIIYAYNMAGTVPWEKIEEVGNNEDKVRKKLLNFAISSFYLIFALPKKGLLEEKFRQFLIS